MPYFGHKKISFTGGFATNMGIMVFGQNVIRKTGIVFYYLH